VISLRSSGAFAAPPAATGALAALPDDLFSWADGSSIGAAFGRRRAIDRIAQSLFTSDTLSSPPPAVVDPTTSDGSSVTEHSGPRHLLPAS
jgi:hypothetical protein